MKILYLARCCRLDLLHPVCMLAREITTWNTTCDKRLHRLICYIKTKRTHCLHGWIGDPSDKLSVMLFTDASFADCITSAKFHYRRLRGACWTQRVLPRQRRVQETIGRIALIHRVRDRCP
eukprot:5361138-Pyramimonas_sp.AAC.1